jgi:hypothetical protein
MGCSNPSRRRGAMRSYGSTAQRNAGILGFDRTQPAKRRRALSPLPAIHHESVISDRIGSRRAVGRPPTSEGKRSALTPETAAEAWAKEGRRASHQPRCPKRGICQPGRSAPSVVVPVRYRPGRPLTAPMSGDSVLPRREPDRSSPTLLFLITGATYRFVRVFLPPRPFRGKS